MAKVTVAKKRGLKTRRYDGSRATAKLGATESRDARRGRSVSGRKSIENLAAEQGIKPTRLEDILGKGADLWESNREFEQFLEAIYASRSEDRELAKQ